MGLELLHQQRTGLNAKNEGEVREGESECYKLATISQLKMQRRTSAPTILVTGRIQVVLDLKWLCI